MKQFFAFLCLFACAWSLHGGELAAQKLDVQPCIVNGVWNGVTVPTPDMRDCSPEQTRYGSGDFRVWIDGFSVTSTIADPLVLRTASLWQDAVALDVLYADGQRERVNITSATTSRNLRPGAVIEYTLPPRDSPIVAILAQTEGSANIRGVLRNPQIVSQREAHRQDVVLASFYAAVTGVLIALLIYNFALWAVMRQRFQLAYCTMLVAMIAYVFSASGALAWVIPAIDNNDRLRVNYAMLTLVGVGGALFARHYFEARIFPRWFVRATYGVIASLLLATTMFVIAAPAHIQVLDAANSIAYAALLSWVAPMIGFAIRGRNRFIIPFAAAWSVPILCALVRVMSNLGVIGVSFWVDNSTFLALFVEALMSAIAITYRVRLLSEERDRARADENMAKLRAETDPITGLPNRSAFMTRIKYLEGAQRLLLVEIDDFKAINDSLGHAEGNRLLHVVADVLRETMPGTAVLARLNGVKFAVLVPEVAADPVSPAELVAKIRDINPGGRQKLSANVGIADGAWHDEAGWVALYDRAEWALREARAVGGGRVVMKLVGKR